MEAFINYLLQFGHLNQQQIDLIKSKGIFKQLKKDEYFSEAGHIPREIIFLTEGIFRVCYFNNKGDEITKYFIEENNFVVDINSYNQSIPSSEYLQTINDCKFIVFSREAMKELSMTIIPWDDGRRCNRTLPKLFHQIPQTGKPYPLILFSFLPWHYTILIKQDQKKYQ